MYTVEERVFLFRKYWQTGLFPACQTAFRIEFGERRAPSNCCFEAVIADTLEIVFHNLEKGIQVYLDVKADHFHNR
jgi:hypothetical protein